MIMIIPQIHSAYSCCVKSVERCEEFLYALCYCVASLGRHSLYFYFLNKRSIALLPFSGGDVQQQEKILRLVKELEKSPEEALFWLNKLSPKNGEETRGIALLRKFLSGWIVYQGRDEFFSVMRTLHSHPSLFLESDLAIKKCVYQCLKGYEGCKELQDRFTYLRRHIEPVRCLLEERGPFAQRLLEEIRHSNQWSSRDIVFYNRRKFNVLNSQPASLLSCFSCARHLHTGFFSRDPHLGLINRHMTKSAYDENMVRDIELLGSDILKIEAVRLIPKEKRTQLLGALHCANQEELAQKLNEKLERIFEQLFQEAKSASLSNSSWTRNKTLLMFPWSIEKIYDRPYHGSMQCVHFVGLTVAKAIHQMEADVQEEAQDPQMSLLHPIPLHTNPASLTPSQLYSLLAPFCGPPTS